MREQIGPYLCRLSTVLAPICPKAHRVERSALQGKAYAATNDDVRAFERYRLAVEQGHPLAQIQLGDCYKKGQGVPKDEALAAAWYRKAADKGSLAKVALKRLEQKLRSAAAAEKIMRKTR